jgi:hypothetical protein
MWGWPQPGWVLRRIVRSTNVRDGEVRHWPNTPSLLFMGDWTGISVPVEKARRGKAAEHLKVRHHQQTAASSIRRDVAGRRIILLCTNVRDGEVRHWLNTSDLPFMGDSVSGPESGKVPHTVCTKGKTAPSVHLQFGISKPRRLRLWALAASSSYRCQWSPPHVPF